MVTQEATGQGHLFLEPLRTFFARLVGLTSP